MILITIVDVEFGKLQARDMLQHLWTGPISNASVDVVQGSKSVEVRAVGVTKVNWCFLMLNMYSFDLFALHMLSFRTYQLYFVKREQQLIVSWEKLFTVNP